MSVLRCLRAAQMHLAGHMRPAGRVFETPALTDVKKRNRNTNLEIRIFLFL
jgi:hypothetical protein